LSITCCFILDALFRLTRAAPQETSRASRPLAGRADRYNSGFFIKHKRELTTLAVLRYSSRHKKGGLKILSLSDKAVIAVRKYLINAVNGFRDGKEPPHLVRDPAKNHFPHDDVIAEIIPANVHWSQYYPHLTSAGVSTSAAYTPR
jgi:hypothetical protein